MIIDSTENLWCWLKFFAHLGNDIACLSHLLDQLEFSSIIQKAIHINAGMIIPWHLNATYSIVRDCLSDLHVVLISTGIKKSEMSHLK